MFVRTLHSIVSVPIIYNAVQVFFGANKKKQIVLDQKLNLTKDSFLLDLGGGTALYRDLWPADCRYICLDNDLIKLGKVIKNPSDSTLLADATKIPIKDNSVDVVFCNSMSHHISDQIVDDLMKESARVLKPTGKMVFLDAVLRKDVFLNSLLWKLDRGEFPHTKEVLTSLIKKYFIVDVLKEYSSYYDYVFFVATKKHKC